MAQLNRDGIEAVQSELKMVGAYGSVEIVVEDGRIARIKTERRKVVTEYGGGGSVDGYGLGAVDMP